MRVQMRGNVAISQKVCWRCPSMLFAPADTHFSDDSFCFFFELHAPTRIDSLVTPRNESHEVNRLLSNPDHFAAWTRVAEDPDTMYLAKSIGDFLG